MKLENSRRLETYKTSFLEIVVEVEKDRNGGVGHFGIMNDHIGEGRLFSYVPQVLPVRFVSLNTGTRVQENTTILSEKIL